jgi:hypothetical protein
MSQISEQLKERANTLHAASAWGIDHDGWLMEKAAEEIGELEQLREADAWLEQALLQLLYENNIKPSSVDILKARRRRREALGTLAQYDQELGLE